MSTFHGVSSRDLGVNEADFLRDTLCARCLQTRRPIRVGLLTLSLGAAERSFPLLDPSALFRKICTHRIRKRQRSPSLCSILFCDTVEYVAQQRIWAAEDGVSAPQRWISIRAHVPTGQSILLRSQSPLGNPITSFQPESHDRSNRQTDRK